VIANGPSLRAGAVLRMASFVSAPVTNQNEPTARAETQSRRRGFKKNGSEKAAHHARAAIAALLKGRPRPDWDRVSPRQFVPLMADHISCSPVGIAPHRLQTVVDAGFPTRGLKTKSIATLALLQEKRIVTFSPGPERITGPVSAASISTI
jgi:hypothetical protein